MVHVGTEAYYEDVTRRLRSCQLVVAEGVSGRSTAISALTAAYRIPGRRKRLGLTTQKIDLSGLDVPVIKPDFTAGQFDAGWRVLPIFFRLAVLALMPILGIWMALVGSKAALARYLECDDLPSREEMEASTGQWERFDDLVVHDRDVQLLRCLDEIHEQRSLENINVAIVYGAAHMRAVVRYLAGRYAYFAREAEWMTVFSF
jgi:hypothetical protein